MHFKLLIAFVNESKTRKVIDMAKKQGATGVTIINHARGEGLRPCKTFLGLSLQVRYDVILFLVEQHRSREILEKIGETGEFDSAPGRGIAIQVDVEDALGMSHQIQELVVTHLLES